jgi:hypothetical protein
MRSIWIANCEGNEIRIENSWFRGEKLFVNNKLQDERLSFFSSNLTGHFISKDGKKIPIKANLSGWFTIGCRLFIDDEKIEITKTK